ncbi:vesicle coat component [Neopestalotiopsis sp. 37M]|nr:vesicle coat component [Neopestalotiopsis sp. 37M]
MASDTQSASWHPAMMPNFQEDSPAPRHYDNEPQVQQEPETEPPVEQAQLEPIPDTPSQTIPPETTSIEPQSANDGAFLDQFASEDPDAGGWDLDLEDPEANTAFVPQEELSSMPEAAGDDPDAGGWGFDLEDAEASAVAAPQEEAASMPEAGEIEETPTYAPEPEPEQEAEQEPEIRVEPPPQSNAAKHSSTISFTRTVSHEVNFNDDDDDEWNLQRTDTDPFNFMGPNERTNSFPAVPPAEHVVPEQLEQPSSPPPATQAQEIMQEIENETQEPQSAAEPDFMRSFGDSDAQEQQGDASFPLGGDLVGTEEAASEARFEEGLPLIPQDEAMPDNEPHTSAGFDDTFADETANDDFFSQMQGPEVQEVEDPFAGPALQRKDTSVFTNVTAGTDAFAPETPTIAEADPIEAEEPFPTDPEPTDVSQASQAEEPAELDAKWAAAFGEDDDDFLLEDSNAEEEKELDPAAFFGSDDEGFLEDDADDSAPTTTQVQESAPSQASTAAPINRYTPAALPTQTPPLLNTFNSAPSIPQVQQVVPPQYSPVGIPQPAAGPYGAAQPKPDVSRAQSFADKAKGGYASPYDLPMDVVRPPRHRTSMQQLPRANTTAAAPPPGPARSTSMYSQPPPPASVAPVPIPSPPSSSGSNLPTQGLKAAPKLTSKSSFFEELPMTAKPRTTSRQNSLTSQQTPQGPPQGPPQAPPQMTPQAPVSGPPVASLPPQSSPAMAGLVAPERSSPFMPLPNAAPQQGPAATNRYSPAPPQGSTANSIAPPVAATSRYSPAPPSRTSSGTFPHAPPPILAHQPRTSSPLAHFEASHGMAAKQGLQSTAGQVPPIGRSASSQYEPRLTRAPSLPTTTEVDEDALPSAIMQSPQSIPSAARYSPQQVRSTPPPTSSPAASTLSPPKRAISNYAPIPQPSSHLREVNFAPPPRSQTQSPGAAFGRVTGNPADAMPRPSSAQGPMSPRQTSAPAPANPPVTRARGMSQVLSMVPPTDGRELDPLQRWRGAPTVTWGMGGVVVTSFPKDVPRYGISQALPMIVRSPGEVKVQNIKDVHPIEERLSKFPGPLKGKSKKKEVLAWLSSGIETLEKESPNVAFQQHVSHEDKRTIERILLWKILRVMVENDGVLEGNANVEKAVRLVLSPELGISNSDEPNSPVVTMADLQGATMGAYNSQSDAVDSSAIEQIRKHLLSGDREKAVWAAVDKRLWGHAMLISSTVQGDLYKQVTQEFIKKEVNHADGSNGSLATLYGVLSGNHEESVDALVPSHARAGLQLMSTSLNSGQSADALSGLDKWRETLGMVLSNRSTNDIVAITSLGNLLSSYGRAEAAHICFLFARKHAIFGGLDDPNANFVLVGADHRGQADQSAKETEALLLSEVYEFGLALSGSSTQQSCPHLAAYKLQHAITLAEYGFRDKALAYCESIMNAVTAQTKRSPYYHPALMSAVDDLSGRLKLAPKEGGSSWISKPTMNQVSNSMWDKFNKFVSGDDAQGAGQASPGEPGAESGPFARIGGGTPTISRSPSVNNFETFGGPTPNVAASQMSSRYAPNLGQRAASSYEPNSTYAPRSSGEYHRGSLELPQRSSLDLPRPGPETLPSMYGGSSVENSSTGPAGYQPAAASQYTPLTPGNGLPVTPQSSANYSPFQPAVASEASASPYSPYQPTPAQESAPSYSPYQPVDAPEPAATANAEAAEAKPEIAVNDFSAANGYSAPSYGGFQPLTVDEPSHQLGEAAEITPAGDTAENEAGQSTSGSGWEAPTYTPYSYEPPTSYEPDPEGGEETEDQPKPKKKGIMDDDDDDFPSVTASPSAPQGKSKAEKDRENQEMFRKVAEEEAKRAAEAKGQKKGWLGGWFGGGGAKKEAEMPANKPIRAKLGESSSFYYDPDQKRWINKKGGAEDTTAKAATPPPPRANGTPPPPGASSSAPPRSAGTPPPMGGPPMGMPRSVSNLSKMASMDNLTPPGPALGGAPPMLRSASNMSNMSNASADSNGPPALVPPGISSAPPTRPSTSLSNASSIDDLLGAAGPRKPGGKKAKKGGRYVDIMAK